MRAVPQSDEPTECLRSSHWVSAVADRYRYCQQEKKLKKALKLMVTAYWQKVAKNSLQTNGTVGPYICWMHSLLHICQIVRVRLLITTCFRFLQVAEKHFFF